MGYFEEKRKKAENKVSRLPEDLKVHINDIIRGMDSTQEIKEHLRYIDELDRSISRQRERLKKIEKEVVSGEKKWLELREYRKAIELMLIELRTSIYYLEDERIERSRPHGKVRKIFEDRGRLEIQLLRAVREMEKYIREIDKSNYGIKVYFRYLYYEKKSIHRDRGVEVRRINNER